jgi:hypothetical protein
MWNSKLSPGAGDVETWQDEAFKDVDRLHCRPSRLFPLSILIFSHAYPARVFGAK